jgi:hypothetical protein
MRRDGARNVFTARSVFTDGHGDRTVSRTDVARPVSTTAGTATAASRLNCDFNMIILIHMIKKKLRMMNTIIILNMEAWGYGRRKSVWPRHCERSEAIAYTTDRLSASATASYLAVTAAVLRKGIKPNTTKNTGSHLLILNSKVIPLNHENHFNHMEITVQTNEHSGHTVSRSTDVVRNVSTGSDGRCNEKRVL